MAVGIRYRPTDEQMQVRSVVGVKEQADGRTVLADKPRLCISPDLNGEGFTIGENHHCPKPVIVADPPTTLNLRADPLGFEIRPDPFRGRANRSGRLRERLTASNLPDGILKLPVEGRNELRAGREVLAGSRMTPCLTASQTPCESGLNSPFIFRSVVS